MTTEPLAPGPALERARVLTLRYVLTATAILLVSGLLGMLLRDSQANLGRLPSGWFYALMTAHGLGAFVGWAGFALMGASFWVLAQVGFPLRRFGDAMAEATYWLMVAGVGGVVLTTLAFRFGGSWVFLYPISFHGAGEWGDWTPYAVIPLTVIGIDMIIATLPLAVLLVEMIVQSANPGVHVDPLLAKNVLWFFGHPVVYLLLFPAVAVYYLLVPRYAGRPLVAGNVVTVGWTIAVIANVLVWAHHIYLDYPSGSPQAAINTAMQPLTFSLTIVSALSLYSLFFTIYRSNWVWNGASTALFLGLVSWLLSGISGVVNATVAFDAVVHNTLWIVGHFHHMALLNIGFVVFAVTYAFVPELTGKPLYSEALAMWHIWLTFLFGLANSAIWYVEGLEGGPRRFAVLPDRYDSYETAAIPVVLALAATQLLFVWNLAQTLRGAGVERAEAAARGPAVARRRRRWPDAAAEAVVVLLVLGLMTAAGFVGWVIGHYAGGTKTKTVTTPATTSLTSTSVSPPANAAGKAVFSSAACGSCHTLADAGSTGSIGPNLDQAKPSVQLVMSRVTNGKGAMPAFKSQLTKQQIRAVAAYVAQATK